MCYRLPSSVSVQVTAAETFNVIPVLVLIECMFLILRIDQFICGVGAALVLPYSNSIDI